MKKIVVIEDNYEVRENLKEILELSSYEVFTAENGKLGIEKIQEVHPDLILCDVMMPVLDGFGVLKILNSNPEYMQIPFMFLTAKAEKMDLRKGMGLGADDYIIKPFDDVDLLEAIEIRLKKSEILKSHSQADSGTRSFVNEAKGEKDLLKLTENKEVRRFQKKDKIYDVGQIPKWLYYVVSGNVKCYQTNEFGKEYITHIYGEGDFIGFLPVLTECKHEDTAMSMDEVQVKLIPKDEFMMMMYNNRDFNVKFVSILAKALHQSESQLIELAYSSVRKKVANALLTLSSKSSNEHVKVLREDIASMAGTAKETTIRTISDFKSEGIIEIEGGDIIILDHHALENMPQ